MPLSHSAPQPLSPLRVSLLIILLALVDSAHFAEPASALQDPKAVDHAAKLRKSGVRPADITADLAKTFRLDANGAALVLGKVDVSAGEARPALEAVFRIGATESVAALSRAGYPIDDVARDLRRVPGATSRDVYASLSRAEFSAAELNRVAVNVLMFSAGEYATAMYEDGAPINEVAQVLKDGYRLEPAPAGDTLVAAGFDAHLVPEVFRLVWGLSVQEAYQALEDMYMGFPGIWNALEYGGYEAVIPRIHRFRIPDYRPGYDGQTLDNVGVVDPSNVTPAPDPFNGEVEILLDHRDLDLTVTLGGRVGEIIGREPHLFQADGVTHDGEWMRVRFNDFPSGNLTVSRVGKTMTVEALSLAYHVLDEDLITGPLSGFEIVLGDPVGTGTLTVPAGTYGGIPVAASEDELEVPTYRANGIEANVVDFASSNVSVTTVPAGTGVVQIRMKVEFEESGAEVEGTFLEYIPCWKCSTFEVPVSECSGLNIACFAGVLAMGVASLGSCLDPANWEEVEVASGPALPFQADLSSALLTIHITIGPQGSTGAFAALQVMPLFDANVALRSSAGSVSTGVIQNWILSDVNASLMQSIQELDLGGAIVEALELGRSTFSWGDVRGVYVLDDGRWFIDSKH